MSEAPARPLERLRAGAGPAWHAYVAHPFVVALGDGALPQAAFRRYLVQDWLFLIQFARAAALAAYKSDTLDELRAASATLQGLLEVEMPLHRRFCAGWGIGEDALASEPEALETTAYTRFVLERGVAGDRLDLAVALAPCIHGYAEIGARLGAAQDAGGANPYADWIATYAGAAYQAVAEAAAADLARLWAARGGDARARALQSVFDQAVMLEAAFWDMGLRAAADAVSTGRTATSA